MGLSPFGIKCPLCEESGARYDFKKETFRCKHCNFEWPDFLRELSKEIHMLIEHHAERLTTEFPNGSL